MSLNWKEINLILEELELPGMQIQKAVQSNYEVLSLKLYSKSGAKNLLVSISPLACRMHETFAATPKSDKPLRFAEFLNSRIINGRIEEAIQLGSDRIVRLTLRCHSADPQIYRIYLRLWSNAANVIVTDLEGKVLDAMKRLPKKSEVSGGLYTPELKSSILTSPDYPCKEYRIRDFPDDLLSSLPSNASFNQKIDLFYRMEGSALSLDVLREEARKKFEGQIYRLSLSLETLREKEADFSRAELYREYGDLILSNICKVNPGGQWLEVENIFQEKPGMIRIKLDPQRGPAASAADYYGQYKKAKSGLEEIRKQIEESERKLKGLSEKLSSLLAESNPLILHKLLKSGGVPGREKPQIAKADAKRPGLSFRRGNWLLIVGRDAAENDALLRKHVKGNDIWLHARDFPGSYVFIKQQACKTVLLDILLDAGNLAIFYSKGRNSREGDLFYTPVKYLRRAKDGPKGTVIPTQEKNLHVRLEERRLKELEECRVEKTGK